MGDIVERLRRGVYPDETGFGSTEATMALAADEIRRLRAENERLDSVLFRISCGWTENATIDDAMKMARAALEGK